MEKKEIIVDVRELYEFNAEKIEGSICVPMSMMESGGADKIISLSKPNTKIILMCHSGARAGVCKQYLQAHCKGELEVYEGGIVCWVENGNPTV